MKFKYPLSKPYIKEEEYLNIKKVLKSGWLSYGKYAKKLEEAFGNKIKNKNVISTNSCTSGIHASLIANNIGKNDEVITSPFTFVSTINNLYQEKCRINLCDINLKDCNIDVNEIKKKISSKTKCILPTHYGGNPCDITEILKLKKKYPKLKLIEDAATAIGAKINKKYIGSFKSEACVFSLYSNKIITSGEGGIVVSNKKKTIEKIKNLIFCGVSKNIYSRSNKINNWDYDVNNLGFKYNISDLHASIGLAQLKKLDHIISLRQKLRVEYNSHFSNFYNDKILDKIETDKLNTSSNYIYCFLINPEKLKISRNELIKLIAKKGIASTVHYIPANKHKFYKKIFKKFKLKNSDFAFNNFISLPFYTELKKNDIFQISKIVQDIIKKNYVKKYV